MQRTSRRAGFTLIELMVVVVILGIIATITFGHFIGEPDRARWQKANVELREIGKALDLYRVDHGVYPDRLDLLAGRLDTTKLRDPFTRLPYHYERGPDGSTYTLQFLGKDGAEGDAPPPDQDIVLTERG
ncbi:MAG: type II secretion system protein GspG [Planctomycetaceae bacterium]|nr:Type II secretion system protein G [Planctomycetota bacterium]MCQ3949401.1 type II secretion system protein GspG [Planctomycetota bacterium]NUO16819.1 type II secretion system protein GspG [Planctomycetaceae bacterium]GIK54106.1 MAG: type II secretion system protein GspG [Planctomycetota bacterium]